MRNIIDRPALLLALACLFFLPTVLTAKEVSRSDSEEAMQPTDTRATESESAESESADAESPESDSPESESPESESSEAESEETPVQDTFLDTITVTTTRGERTVGETAGTVTVIGAEQIEKQLAANVVDLVRYEPGVEVANDLGRLGPNGFIIRGLGGNRVLTQVDGVPSSEEFAFGPLAIHQIQPELESLQSVEIVRSASSPLYGSDALGGLVSFTTKRPGDYLGSEHSHLEVSTAYRGADEQSRVTAVGAVGNERWSASALVSYRQGSEPDNQGSVDSEDSTRTTPNPMDRRAGTFLLRADRQLSDRNRLGLSLERIDSQVDTDVYSLQGEVISGREVRNVVADDSQERWRINLDQTIDAPGGAFDTVTWHAYGQTSETEQIVNEERVAPTGNVHDREGLFSFDQETVGGDIQFRKVLAGGTSQHLLTYGAAVTLDTFDMLRDREDVDRDTGEEVVSFGSVFPTKYFPESDATQLGVFVQDEIDLVGGRLRLIPGLRYDSYDLDPRRNDEAFLAGNPGQPEPTGFSDDALSPKLGLVYDTASPITLFAQYARGFRAPPYSSINTGFTNFLFGYTTFPNPDLTAETSDNYEVGVRGKWSRGGFSLTAFDNRYEDFIDQVSLGFDPVLGLLVFQAQNIDDARTQGLELAGDAHLVGPWSLRGSFAYIEGENEETDEPLNSITPPQLVLGLEYGAASGRWGASLVGTFTASKDGSDLDRTAIDQTGIPSSEVLDLLVWVDLGDSGLSLQAGIFNLTDETYWTWPNALGLEQGAPQLERYTNPGTNASVALRWRR